MADDTDHARSTGVTTDAFGSISAISAGWFGAVLTALALAAFVGVTVFLPTSSLGFAALAGTAILSVSLTALIIVFRAIGILDPQAALGFPRGSVRALLAFGLTIVFVAIASWTLGGMFDPIGPLVAQVTIPSTDQDAYNTYRKRYPEPDYIFTETQLSGASSLGTAPVQSDRAGSPPDRDRSVGGQPAPTVGAADLLNIKIYMKRKAQDQSTFDLAKQIMTTIATVLVTIVGFYFGSHSSADASRTLSDALGGVKSAPGGPGGAAPPNSPDDVDKTATAINALAVATKAKLDSFGADPIAMLGGSIANTPADSQLAAKLASAQQAFEEMKKSTAACATDADRAKDVVTSLGVNAGTAQVKNAYDRLQTLLADATQSNHDFEQKLAQWADARNFILQRTAKG
jgi:hypothetical protein